MGKDERMGGGSAEPSKTSRFSGGPDAYPPRVEATIFDRHLAVDDEADTVPPHEGKRATKPLTRRS